MSAQKVDVGREGIVVLPDGLRRCYSLIEGSVLIADARLDGLMRTISCLARAPRFARCSRQLRIMRGLTARVNQHRIERNAAEWWSLFTSDLAAW
jgi:bifunctional DNA-binding transcriptional regulator/antitoxin component of YhaV-PrlF toxin-antitoxin module